LLNLPRELTLVSIIQHRLYGTHKVKVKVNWICTAPRREQTSKALRYGTRSQGISQCYLHTPRSSANGMNHTWNHTCLCLSSQSWYSFTDPGGMEGWVGLGWLIGYIPK